MFEMVFMTKETKKELEKRRNAEKHLLPEKQKKERRCRATKKKIEIDGIETLGSQRKDWISLQQYQKREMEE